MDGQRITSKPDVLPLYDDTGADEQLGPIWSSFRTLRDQIERFVTLNIAWSIHLLPGLAGLAFQEWPLGLRTALVMYSAVAIVPMSGAVYVLVARACDSEQIDLRIGVQAVRTLAVPSMRSLAPLYAALGGLAILAAQTGQVGTPAAVLLRLLVMLGLLCGTYWGPLLADDPRRSPLALLRGSIQMTLRFPWPTLLTFVAVLLTGTVGAVSVGGLFLIVFVLIALLQTQLYLDLRRKLQRAT